MNQLDPLLDHPARTRDYTPRLLEQTDRARRLEVPAGSPTHIGWPVGHRAVTEAALLWVRLLGEQRWR